MNTITKFSTVLEATQALNEEKLHAPKLLHPPLRSLSEATGDCSADLGHECDSGADGGPCESCVAEEAYWLNWAKGQHVNRYSDDEIRDAYSDPTEWSKRDALLSRS